jgi:hypothetical protein
LLAEVKWIVVWIIELVKVLIFCTVVSTCNRDIMACKVCIVTSILIERRARHIEYKPIQANISLLSVFAVILRDLLKSERSFTVVLFRYRFIIFTIKNLVCFVKAKYHKSDSDVVPILFHTLIIYFIFFTF